MTCRSKWTDITGNEITLLVDPRQQHELLDRNPEGVQYDIILSSCKGISPKENTLGGGEQGLVPSVKTVADVIPGRIKYNTMIKAR